MIVIISVLSFLSFFYYSSKRERNWLTRNRTCIPFFTSYFLMNYLVTKWSSQWERGETFIEKKKGDNHLTYHFVIYIFC